jgi:eukaryotic-like serine/threonine-protein kinase
MANTTTNDIATGSVAGLFTIDFAQSLPDAAGAQPAFAAHAEAGGLGGLMAVQVQLGLPARARALSALAAVPIPNLLVPLGHGPARMPSGETGYFVICPAPPGRPLSAAPLAWSEHDLVEHLLKPAASVLRELQSRHMTHRAIRPDNLFRAGPRDYVTLGCAWAAPPAYRQSALWEPPYVASCLAAGRGEGTIADDVYALGVVMVMLALGQDPLAGLDDEAIIRRKLEVGSFAAIVGTHRLPVAIAELVRGMLADDPEHRPSPALLSDPMAARARRIAARPPRRAQRPIEIGGVEIWTARVLAHAILREPEQGAALLRTGAVESWLRRSIGDGAMASRMDEVSRVREVSTVAQEAQADALLVTRAIAILDPLAPLSWRNVAIWPDGLGPALNHALQTNPGQALAVAEIAMAEVAPVWGALRPDRSDLTALKIEARQQKSWMNVKPAENGVLRLSYALNPLAPCGSALIARHWVTRLPELLPALEAAAATPSRAKSPPVDRQIITFIAARRDERVDTDLAHMASVASDGDPLAQLRLLAQLQVRHPGPLPGLAAWAAEIVNPALGRFHSKSRRTQLAERLAGFARAGQMPPMQAMLDDQPEQRADRGGRNEAIARAAVIDRALAAITADSVGRQSAARRIGQDIVGGVSLLACGVALAFALLG